MSRECNSTAESTFDVNVSRELQLELEPGDIVNTAHCLRSMLCFISKCFIILLVLPPLFTITLLHILHLTLVSLSFVT